MKPFDLDKVKNGAQVVTREGLPVTILKTDLNDDEEYCVVGFLREEGGVEKLESWTKEGLCFHNGDYSDRDLFMKPITSKGWVNIYKNRKISDHIYETKAEAINASASNAIDTIEIEWEV